MATNEWNPTTLGKLKALLTKGLSTAEIGKKLGITKNSVVGKLNRLGWNAKAATSKFTTPKAPAKPPRPAVGKSVAKTAAPTKVGSAQKKSTSKTSPAVKPGTISKIVPPAKSGIPAKPNAKQQIGKFVPIAKTGTKTPTKFAPSKSDASPGSKNLAMHQRIIQHSLELASLRPDQCRWPIGDPDSEKFHFCGATVFVGKPYCYEHCKQAYQFAPAKGKK